MRVRVEVADTPYKLSKGLMNRHRLPADSGMLFVFPRPQVLGFWGQNTFIPLDIAFVDTAGTIVKTSRIETLSKKNVSSDVPCAYAIEVNAGYFEQHGIKAGDKVQVAEDHFEGTVVLFKKNAGNGPSSDETRVKLSAWWNPADWFGRKSKQVTIPDTSKTPFTPQIDQPQQPEAVQAPQPEQTELQDDDEAGLPVVTPDGLEFADDDIDEEAAEEPIGYDEDGQPIFQKPETEPGDEIPDATTMSPMEASNEGIQKKLVMLTTYRTVPKKRTIGPIRGGREIMREVEPHGVFHAKSTGNTILVTWDRDVQGIRAFVLDRIVDKVFTGEHFDKKFVVKG